MHALHIEIFERLKKDVNALFRSYFGSDGIEYGIGRIPLGGTDFSTYAYTYDDIPGDVNLTHFSLMKEDFFYKVFNIS